MAVFDLENKIAMIPPGKSLIIEHMIYRDFSKQFGNYRADISAIITVAAKIIVDDKHVDFEGSDSILIIGKDKP